MPRRGIRPVDEEEVGEAGDGDGLVGLGAAEVDPVVAEGDAVLAHDLEPELGVGEAGGLDDDVDVNLLAGGGDDAGRGDGADGVVCEVG